MGKKIKKPSKEDIVNYYIKTTRSQKEAAEFFEISLASFQRILRDYQLHKDATMKQATFHKSVEKRIVKYSAPSKEELESYYIIENHSKKEVANYYNVSLKVVSRWFRVLNIKKPKDTFIALCKKHSAAAKSKPSYDELFREYYNKNISIEQLAKKYQVDSSTMQRWIAEYGLQKTREQYYKTARKTWQDKYGLDTPNQKNLRHIDIWLDDKKFIQYVIDNSGITIADLRKFFHAGQNTMLRKIHLLKVEQYINMQPNISEDEKDICTTVEELIGTNKVESNVRDIINHYEIDVYVPSCKIGIEYNGTYWHSSEQKEKNYHFDKSKAAEAKGVRLIHIYEYEWSDPIKRPIVESLLKIALNINNNRIYARKCEVREISNKDARLFNETNHLQGHRNAQVTYGLFYKGELVQLMSFSKTKYNRNLKGDNSWEIIRGCPGSNNIVVGGVSKLFKHFIKEYNPDEVFSYCDFNKFDGKGYEAIGMKFIGYTGPDMKWVMKDGSVVERQPKNHKKLKEKSVAQIWGAGSKKYLWTKQ